MIGAGKYDDLCTYVREHSKAEGALDIIINGDKGPGFSCQASIMTLISLPELLRDVANQIERSHQA